MNAIFNLFLITGGPSLVKHDKLICRIQSQAHTARSCREQQHSHVTVWVVLPVLLDRLTFPVAGCAGELEGLDPLLRQTFSDHIDQLRELACDNHLWCVCRHIGSDPTFIQHFQQPVELVTGQRRHKRVTIHLATAAGKLLEPGQLCQNAVGEQRTTFKLSGCLFDNPVVSLSLLGIHRQPNCDWAIRIVGVKWPPAIHLGREITSNLLFGTPDHNRFGLCVDTFTVHHSPD